MTFGDTCFEDALAETSHLGIEACQSKAISRRGEVRGEGIGIEQHAIPCVLTPQHHRLAEHRD